MFVIGERRLQDRQALRSANHLVSNKPQKPHRNTPTHNTRLHAHTHIQYTHEAPMNDVFFGKLTELFVTEMIDISSGSRKDTHPHTRLRAVSFFMGGRKQLFKR